MGEFQKVTPLFCFLRNEDSIHIDIKLQEKINHKIQESFNLKQQSKQLLEIAKIGVEKAIENDEEKAIFWIKEELGRLGIEV